MPDLGILNPLFKDDSITEVMINDTRNVFIEKAGKLVASGLKVPTHEDLLKIVKNITESGGRQLTNERPYADLTLPDGSRVNIIVPPLTVGGAAVTIRRFPKRRPSADDLMANHTFDQRLGYFLNVCVVGRRNILVSGGTGSGKTTLLNLFCQFVPRSERLVTIEDTPEIFIQHENSVRMVSRPRDGSATPIDARELVANALRMRPDRIILGECRRGEAFDMLQAMNTGHDGSMTTLHANSPREALYRLETLVSMAGVDLPLSAMRKYIASSIDMIVQIRRFRSGARKITHVTEVTGMEGETILLQDIFELKSEEDGVAKALGFVPTFLKDLQEMGVQIGNDYFG
ncbi:MAG: CpaF family protein [Deltaproteobacteria bacterium]|nr:CpaF family protein [Deltaproteobacteria bacterium]